MWSEEIEEPRIPEKLFKIIDTKDSNIVIRCSIHIYLCSTHLLLFMLSSKHMFMFSSTKPCSTKQISSYLSSILIFFA